MEVDLESRLKSVEAELEKKCAEIVVLHQALQNLTRRVDVLEQRAAEKPTYSRHRVSDNDKHHPVERSYETDHVGNGSDLRKAGRKSNGTLRPGTAPAGKDISKRPQGTMPPDSHPLVSPRDAQSTRSRSTKPSSAAVSNEVASTAEIPRKQSAKRENREQSEKRCDKQTQGCVSVPQSCEGDQPNLKSAGIKTPKLSKNVPRIPTATISSHSGTSPRLVETDVAGGLIQSERRSGLRRSSPGQSPRTEQGVLPSPRTADRTRPSSLSSNRSQPQVFPIMEPQEVGMALCMGLHVRLGEGSLVLGVEQGVVRKIVGQYAEWYAPLQAAEAALGKVQEVLKADGEVLAVRGYRAPVPGVEVIVGAMCTLLGHSSDWHTARRVLGMPNLGRQLAALHTTAPPSRARLDKVRQVLGEPETRPQRLAAVSRLAMHISDWLRALILLYDRH